MPLTTVQSGMMDSIAQYNSFKNRIINGAMVIDQRNAGASVTPTVDGTYTLDRWLAGLSSASKFSIEQTVTGVAAPAGFTDYLAVTSSAATSVAAGDYYLIAQRIEGFNCADLAWGTASAQTVTLSFWVRSSLTGTFGASLRNSAANRSYPFTYTISAANTWEQKSVTISGDTSGTWLTNNGTGILLTFGLGIGSTFSGTAGAWVAANYSTVTGATSVVGTNGATFYITGVQLEKGSTATAFDYRPYGTELSLCQRYYLKSYDTTVVPGTASQVNGCLIYKVSSNTVPINEPFGSVIFPVTMRASPTVTPYGFQGGSGKVSNYSGTDLAAASGNIIYNGTNGFSIRNGAGATLTTTLNSILFHFTSDIEL